MTGNDACSYSDQSSCDADDACSWCKCSAVPSKCYNKKDAASLPSSIFACDNLSIEDQFDFESSEFLDAHHKKSDKHKNHDKKGGCHGSCLILPLVLVILTIAQLCNIKKMKNALEELDEANGIPRPSTSCCAFK